MLIPVGGAPHGIRIHDGDVLSLADVDGGADLDVAVNVKVLASVVGAVVLHQRAPEWVPTFTGQQAPPGPDYSHYNGKAAVVFGIGQVVLGVLIPQYGTL